MFRIFVVLVLLLNFAGCSFSSKRSQYDLADNTAYQIQKQELATFERARVQKELSDWD